MIRDAWFAIFGNFRNFSKMRKMTDFCGCTLITHTQKPPLPLQTTKIVDMCCCLSKEHKQRRRRRQPLIVIVVAAFIVILPIALNGRLFWIFRLVDFSAFSWSDEIFRFHSFVDDSFISPPRGSTRIRENHAISQQFMHRYRLQPLLTTTPSSVSNHLILFYSPNFPVPPSLSPRNFSFTRPNR